jgi:acetyltransferase-like isoleucine patch superfamily enzyme
VIAPSSEIAGSAVIADTADVWGLTQVGPKARVGAACVVGRGATIDGGVVLGDRVKVQAHALIYHPAVIEDGAFIGPAAVLTNDSHPRAVAPDGTIKRAEDWTPVGVTVRRGASVGARAVCVAPVTIGRWAMVGAGAVVTHNVPDYALVVGNPARQIGWVGPAGHRLRQVAQHSYECPVTRVMFTLQDGALVEEA